MSWWNLCINGGIGYAKRPYMEKAKDPALLALMQAVKTAFDPDRILPPHKVCKP